MKFLGGAQMWWCSSSLGGYKFAEWFCPWYEARSCRQVRPKHLLGGHHHYYLWAAAPVALWWLWGRPQGWLLVWYHDSWFTPHRLVQAEQEDSQSAWRYWLHIAEAGGTYKSMVLSFVSLAGSLRNCCYAQVRLLWWQVEVVCHGFLKSHELQWEIALSPARS